MITRETAQQLRKTYIEFDEAGAELARNFINEDEIEKRAEEYCRKRRAHQEMLTKADDEVDWNEER